MLINLEQAEQRANSSNNLINKLISRRSEKQRNLSPEEKIDIHVDSQLMTVEETAEKYSVSPKTVINYKNRSVLNRSLNVDGEDIHQADTRVAKVRDEALDKMMLALGLLNSENLKGQKARDLASIAANLSRVAANTSDRGNSTAVQVVVYAPQQRQISDYEVIEVSK